MTRRATRRAPAPTAPDGSRLEVRWRPGYQGSRRVRPELAFGVLKRIEKSNGSCRPADVVEAARDESSPIHELFEWDDAKCGESFRRDQAREIIGGLQPIRITVSGEIEPVSPACYVHVGTREQSPRYVSIEHVNQSPELRRQAVLEAISQMQALARRHAELAAVLGTLEQIHREVAKTA